DEYDDGVVHPGGAERLLRLHDVLDGDRLVDVGAHDDLPEVRLIALHHVGQVQRILVGELEIQGGVLVARYAEADEVQIAFALTRVGGRPARAEGLDAADIERGDLDRVEALAELDAFAHAGRRAVERRARPGERRHAVDVDLVARERGTGRNPGPEQRSRAT